MTIIDFDHAYLVWLGKNKNLDKNKKTKKAFLSGYDVSEQTAWNIQNGKRENKSLEAAIRMAEDLEIPLSELIKSIK